jgi:hypothetical protein
MYPLVPEETLLTAAHLALFLFAFVATLAGCLWGLRT